MDRSGRYSYDTLISNVKSLIDDKGLKQGYVAKRCGFTPQEFSNIVNGRQLLRSEYIPDIAEAIGVTPNEIFGVA